jgi:formylglycine-generating enzyme required for sulfatase activity
MTARAPLVPLLVGALLGLSVPACDRVAEPTGQVMLYVTTDAPMGPPDGLFDRLIVEVIPPGERAPCEGCTRSFAVDDARMAEGRASFGVAVRPGASGYRARVRLYRGGGSASLTPRVASTLEATVSLPSVGATGIVEATCLLGLATLGKPQGSVDAPVASQPGAPAPGVGGSVLRGRPTACAGEPGEGEVCVPGGASWMGSPRLDVLDAREADGRDERVVLVSPFFMDRAEVTVAELRAAKVARVLDDPFEGDQGRPECLYRAAPSENDGLPVNCLSWQRADAYCKKVGKRLPTEAEYERVAGALVSRAYVWGDGLPACDEAVHAADAPCLAPRGPRPAGSGSRDRLVLSGRTIVDLAGNLREFTQDKFQRGNEACWGPGLFVDPVCEAGPTEELVPRTVRGGSYRDEATLLRSAQRSFVENERFAVSELIGFRCARSAK